MRFQKLLWQETVASTLALFASLGTLVCCALPALLITIGAGAVMAGLATNVPGMILLSAHKGWLFVVAGALLATAATARWLARNSPCPVDAISAQACANVRKAGGAILAAAFAAYGVGGFFAFFAADLLL